MSNPSYQPIGGFALLVEGFSFFAGKYQTPTVRALPPPGSARVALEVKGQPGGPP